jgi:hypothetical protein
MDSQPVNRGPIATLQPQSQSLMSRSWKIVSVVAVIMVLLALLGVALTNANSPWAPTYWMWLVPIYAVLCIGTAWARAWSDKNSRRIEVIRQLLHWLGIGVALFVEHLIRGTGEETTTATGLNELLLLGLGCYLAGVHLEWIFALVGLLLTVILLVIAKAEQYEWILFVVGGLAVAALIGIWWVTHRRQARVVAATKTMQTAPAGS